jgi:choline-glycine betaine transporter
MAQVVEHLHSKSKAQSSKGNTAKKFFLMREGTECSISQTGFYHEYFYFYFLWWFCSLNLGPHTC